MKKYIISVLSLLCIIGSTAFSSVIEATESSYDYFFTPNYIDVKTVPDNYTSIDVGATGQIRPDSNSIFKDFQYALTYTVSDSSVLSIDDTGRWKALKPGMVTITVWGNEEYGANPNFEAELDQYGVKRVLDGPCPDVYYMPVERTILVGGNLVPEPIEEPLPVNLYRLYHPQRGFHTYIKGDRERAALEKRGWRYEGTAWVSALEGNKPVYRLYSAKKDAYVYTRHTSEVERLKATGWRYEGVAFQSSGTKPVYRFYNKRAGIHFYTANPAERDKLKSNAGYRYEGFAWYSE